MVRTSRQAARPSASGGAFVVAAFAAVFIALEVLAYTQKSATWDEPIHLTAGYVALAERDHRVDATHPPFLRMWAALPLRAMGGIALDTARIDRAGASEWLREGYAFAHRFLYVDNDADRLLYAARFMVVLLGVALGALLFAWAREWLGFAPAVFVLAFYTIEPNVAAHASLVTTDLGATCFIFGAAYFLWRASRAWTLWNVAGLTVSVALAVVSKFSGLLLAPVVVLLLAVAVLQRSAITPRRACALSLLLLAASLVAIWAVYGFRYAPSRSPDWLLRVQELPVVQRRSPVLAAAVGWVDAHRILPNAFSQGLLLSQATAQDLPAYLMGEYSTTGWWYYFPVAFLVKTPVAMLLLVAAGLVVYVRRWRRLAFANELFVLVPLAAYLGIAMASGINIGVRHILPVYPFALLISAAAVKELVDSRFVAGRVALAGLTVFWLAMFARVYPHTLTFFNALAGGPRRGLDYLADSNLDWGQHLKLLKAWMDERGVSHVNLAYFGMADPEYYRINCTHLPGAPSFAIDRVAPPRLPGYVAISSTILSGVYLSPEWRLFYRGFRDRAPVADVGNSIRVYWVDRWPEASTPVGGGAAGLDADSHARLADALLFGQRWLDHAIVHYREHVKIRPADALALRNLGLALASSGNEDEAALTLARAVDLQPGDAASHRYLAGILLNRGEFDAAARHAREAATWNPRDAAAHDLLGRALASQNRLEEAEREFVRAVELAPDFTDAADALARVRQLRRR